MSDQQSQEETATCPNNSQETSLNQARFINLEDLESTPSTKKTPHSITTKSCMKKIQQQEESDSEEWRRMLTKSIRKFGMKTPARELEENKEVEMTEKVKVKSSGKYDKSCPICLCQYDSIRGTLDCHHQFCFTCIGKWCQSATVCPCCRKEFTSILKMIRQEENGPIKQTVRVPVEKKLLIVQTEYDHYLCYQCGSGEHEHVLLICDECDFYCCHVYCDEELDGLMPSGNWYCIYCRCRRRQRRRRSAFTSLDQITLRQLELEHRRQESSSSGVSSRTRSHQLIGPLLHNNSIVPRNTTTLLRQVRRQVR